MSSAIGNNVIYIPPQQAPLVNTAVLGSQTTHVPAGNVAPPVSNAQVDNNAKGNGGGYSPAPAPQPAANESSASFNLSSASAAPASVSAPSAFLAQLLAQNTSSDDSITQSLLVGYERLVSLSNVKYKPSNALKPGDGPSGVFGRLLQQEQVPVEATQPVAVAAPLQTVTETPEQTLPAPQAETVPAPTSDTSAADVTVQTTGSTVADIPAPQTPPAATSFILPGVSAYVSTSARNDASIAPQQDRTDEGAPEQSLPSLV